MDDFIEDFGWLWPVAIIGVVVGVTLFAILVAVGMELFAAMLSWDDEDEG